MANEIRRRYNFKSGTITDNPLTNSATTMNSTNLAGLPAVGSTEYAVLVLDPAGTGNGPEVVYVTAHTGSATSATIVRGREGTTAVQHSSNVTWIHVATAADYPVVGDDNDQPSGTGLPYEGQIYIDTTNDRNTIYSGSAWIRQGWYSSTGRTGGEWSRSTNLSVANATATAITFPTEAADSDAFLTPTSGTFTVPSGLDGLYLFDYSVTWGANNGSLFRNWLSVNSTTLPTAASATIGGMNFDLSNSALEVWLTGSAVFRLAANDIVRLMGYQTTGGAYSVTSARFAGWRIGA